MGILDIKTAASFTPDMDLQVAAYDELYRNGIPIPSYDDPTHTYRDENGDAIPATTKILRQAELSPDYSGLDPWYADKGKAVHSSTEYWDKGTLDADSIDLQIEGYTNAYRAFRRDLPLDILGIEVRMWHPVYHYAGTIDRVIKGNSHYLLFLRPTGKYKLVEVKNIRTKFEVFRSAVMVTSGKYTDEQLAIPLANLCQWKKRHLRRAA